MVLLRGDERRVVFTLPAGAALTQLATISLDGVAYAYVLFHDATGLVELSALGEARPASSERAPGPRPEGTAGLRDAVQGS
ncbi:MAG: hypothetical protein R3F62_10330 [Planctomycetota bacterium]